MNKWIKKKTWYELQTLNLLIINIIYNIIVLFKDKLNLLYILKKKYLA